MKIDISKKYNSLPNSELCTICKGRGYCGKPCPILEKFKFSGKSKTHFSGSSPPEIFIGRIGYPNVNTGILSPQEYGNTEEYALPEIWHKKNFQIEKILNLRSRLIYSRFKSKIKDAGNPVKKTRIFHLMQEISLADRKVDTEIVLKKPIKQNLTLDRHLPVIGNPAPLKYARLEENPHIHKKADYLANDTDSKATTSILELYKSKVPISNIIKILSAGLLGKKLKRKLVPTRWSITATDDTISNFLLAKIKYYPEINEFLLFHAEYLGNHYEFLLFPDKFSFEVIEAKIPGSVWNPNTKSQVYFAHDYEFFHKRKTYASNVTGAYYSNQLALCEYLEKIKKQASCLVMRECRPEYYAPLGTGILRETSRTAFKNKPERFSTFQEALQTAQKRMRLPVSLFKNKSHIIKEYRIQKKLNQYFQ